MRCIPNKADFKATIRSIRLHSMEDLEELGLNFDALSLHGHGRDLLMTGWQHNSKLVEIDTTWILSLYIIIVLMKTEGAIRASKRAIPRSGKDLRFTRRVEEEGRCFTLFDDSSFCCRQSEKWLPRSRHLPGNI